MNRELTPEQRLKEAVIALMLGLLTALISGLADGLVRELQNYGNDLLGGSIAVIRYLRHIV